MNPSSNRLLCYQDLNLNSCCCRRIERTPSSSIASPEKTVLIWHLLLAEKSLRGIVALEIRYFFGSQQMIHVCSWSFLLTTHFQLNLEIFSWRLKFVSYWCSKTHMTVNYNA